MVYIYVLKLEHSKYYVGKTDNPYFRLSDHFNSSGSEWTKLYKPIKVLEVKSECDDYDEDKVTKQYMDTYGINNVRGGSFVSVKLDESYIKTLKLMNKGTNDKCFKCGMKGHFANNCLTTIENTEEYNKLNDKLSRKKSKLEELKCTNTFGIKHDRISTIKNQIQETEILINKIENKYTITLPSSPLPKKKYESSVNNVNGCYRCGRTGHYASSCYARTNVMGEYIDESDEEESDEEDIYEHVYEDEDEVVCFRCGRKGHYVSACYARTRINGRVI